MFVCKIFCNFVFVKCFCLELEKKDKEVIERFFIFLNICFVVKFLVMFWCSCYNFVFLIESFFYIIINCIGNIENIEK